MRENPEILARETETLIDISTKEGSTDEKEDSGVVSENKPIITSNSQLLVDSENKPGFAEFFRKFAKVFGLK